MYVPRLMSYLFLPEKYTAIKGFHCSTIKFLNRQTGLPGSLLRMKRAALIEEKTISDLTPISLQAPLILQIIKLQDTTGGILPRREI